MRKIKLTSIQKQKLTEVLKIEMHARQQMETAQAQLNSAGNHLDGILAMIYDAHSIDPTTIQPGARLELSKDGCLVLGETNASARIRKEVTKKTNQNGHAKATTKSKKY